MITIEDVKQYMEARPYIDEIPSDQDLAKLLNFAELILSVFYDIPEEFKDTDEYLIIVCEEVIYLSTCNPTEDIYQMYNYLSSFKIDGVLSGTVRNKAIAFISDLVKALMKKANLDLLITAGGYYTYSKF